MELTELKIDPEFKGLIKALQPREYLQLENNILTDGCREAIITWNGIIVDGHNRYEICKRHNIPFRIKEMDFDCREAVIAWISRGVNQYTSEDFIDPELPPAVYERQLTHRTAERIAEENHISHATVQKYAIYSKALDEIGKHEPELVKKILSGAYKISHENVVELSRRTPEEIRRVNRKIDRNPQPFIQYKRTRNAIKTGYREPIPPEDPLKPTVKDMPEYDPDAAISSLILTIPSWSSSIDRTRKTAKLSDISPKARSNLIDALHRLYDSLDEMLAAIEEED